MKDKGSQYPHRPFFLRYAREVDKEGRPLVIPAFSNEISNALGAYNTIREVRLSEIGCACFYTEVQVYVPHKQIWNRMAPQFKPWRASKEHIMPRALYRERFNGLGPGHQWPAVNFVLSSRAMNNELGHNPASIKLAFRRYLKDKEYDRNDYMNEHQTYNTVFRHLLDYLRSFTMYGKYPWQPQTYELTSHRRAAQDFLNQITQMDEDFFTSIDMQNRLTHFDHSLLPIEIL